MRHGVGGDRFADGDKGTDPFASHCAKADDNDKDGKEQSGRVVVRTQRRRDSRRQHIVG